MDSCVDAYVRARMLRAEEPNSWRDEALARVRRGSRGDWRKAVTLLRRVVAGGWPSRFSQIELIAGLDLARALSCAPVGHAALVAGAKGERIALAAKRWRLLTCDIRILIRWDLDDSDVALEIEHDGQRVGGLINTLPNGGGMLSRNFTGGYGPQEFLVKDGCATGTYKLFVRLHQRTARTLSDCVTVCVNVTTFFGDAQREDEQVHCVRLSPEPSRDEATLVGSIVFTK